MPARLFLLFMQTALLGLLVTAHVLAHFIVSAWWPSTGEIGDVAHNALILSQSALIVLWIVFGPGRKLVRWPLAALLLVPLARAVGTQFTPDAATQIYYLIGTQAVMLLVAGILIRLRKWRLTRSIGGEAPAQLRYSLRSILIMTTVAAVAMVLAQTARTQVAASVPPPLWIGRVTLALPFAIIPLLALWAALNRGSAWLGILILCFAAPVLGLATLYITAWKNSVPMMAAWTSLHALIVVGTLLVFRGCGYRIIKKTRVPESSPSISAPTLELTASETVSDARLDTALAVRVTT